ncbi:MAG: hypothetical protein HZC52_08500 [Planctomycetes bacterium]|nr:hypothetical protein [Planctomycetota bacterium]
MRIQAKIFGLIFIMFVMAVFLTKNTFAGTGFGISNKFTLDTTGVSPTPTTEATPTVINVTVRIKPKVINLKQNQRFERRFSGQFSHVHGNWQSYYR